MLERVIEAAQYGRGAVVTVTGEYRIGKTRLARELYAGCDSIGMREHVQILFGHYNRLMSTFEERKQEVRALLAMTPQAVRDRAGRNLTVCSDIDELHKHFAEAVAAEIRAGNSQGRNTCLILPVGPTGGYPPLLDIIHRERLSLSRSRLFFMDEYCDDTGKAVAVDHPLSFKGVMNGLFFDALNPQLAPDPKWVIFPDEQNVSSLAGLIEESGGIDACFGGVGIHGHVAFNESEPGVAESGPRKVDLNDFTVTINTVRSAVGGNLACFPRYAFTLGMRQVLGARRLRLYCRNGIELDWANTILRLALLGSPGEDYPVTLIRNHPDYEVVADEDTLESPANLI